MNRATIAHWTGPMREFLRRTVRMISSELLSLLGTVFKQYRDTALYTKMTEMIRNFLEAKLQELSQYAEETFNVEYSQPFTKNTSYLKLVEKDTLSKYRMTRRNVRVSTFLDRQERQNARKETTGEAREKEMRKVTDSELGVDPYIKEVEMMAVS